MPQIGEVVIVPAQGRPTVEVVIGGAHVGNYRCFLWDGAGQNPEELRSGDNVDDKVDAFEIACEAKALVGRILSIEMILQAAEARPGQVYAATVTVRQQGTVCKGGLVQQSGTFEDVKALVEFRRFKE